jgi:uncharacterized protein YndB with AHSA1/START domain
LPRYAARRVLPATVEEVWAVLADPERFGEWWPGVVWVQPSVRNALAPGAHWQIEGAMKPSILRRPELTGSLLVLEVETERRLVFQMTGERLDVELDLEPTEDGAAATLVCEAPRFGGIRRGFPSEALAKLADLVRPPAEDAE